MVAAQPPFHTNVRGGGTINIDISLTVFHGAGKPVMVVPCYRDLLWAGFVARNKKKETDRKRMEGVFNWYSSSINIYRKTVRYSSSRFMWAVLHTASDTKANVERKVQFGGSFRDNLSKGVFLDKIMADLEIGGRSLWHLVAEGHKMFFCCLAACWFSTIVGWSTRRHQKRVSFWIFNCTIFMMPDL